jgi:hypothetical protein
MLAEAYRRFGEDAAGTVYGRVAVALSESGPALRALEAVPARKRNPALILAALHYLALAGRAPALAAAYARDDPDAAAAAAVYTVVQLTDQVVAIAVRRTVRSKETGRAVLRPAVAEAAHRAGAGRIGLIDVDCAAGFALTVDRVLIAYDDGRSVGDPDSPVRLSASVVGDGPVPARAMPAVAARIGIDRDPLDVTGADDARWLRACLPPDRPGEALDAEIALLAAKPPRLLRGEAVDLLPDAVAAVPADALPVVTTAWALSRLPLGDRLRFLHRLDDAATHRPVAWVSVEAVGVAPAVPTMGDRHASGHSIVGLAVFDHSTLHVEAVGRCWSRGRLLAWLAGS